MRLLIVPRWSGTGDSDFYPWLREQVADAFTDIEAASLRPTPGAPEIAPCVAELRARLSEDRERTVLLGHSVGNQVVMRTLAELPGPAVAGCLLVAGWYRVDEPWDSIRPWIDAPIDDERVRAMAGPLRVLVSTDDRFTADHEATRAAFESRLGARVRVVEGRDHFNASPQPEVLEELRALLAAVRTGS
ncbi:MAG: alpha/beta hydrolase [Myxococcales bacterium]|nr:alpha/beta hydrolase [Myxococcales bacterium]MCB9715898.1 alpha/beta hydrolase [Myxococcales bacterium]